MKVSRNWIIGNEDAVRVTCSGVIRQSDWDRYLKIAKRQGWTREEIERYIILNGFEVFTTSWHSCDEEYDERGDLIPEEE